MNFDEAYKNKNLEDESKEIIRIENILRRALYEESNRYSTRIFRPENSRDYLCAIKGCGNNAYAKGLCNAHYIRQRNGRDMSLPVRSRKQGVACIDCGEPCTTKGGWLRCAKHYKRRRSQILKISAVYALGSKCIRCGNTYDIPVFDFHHRENKEFSISSGFLCKSIGEIAKELFKCELLCANCHRLEHYHGF